MGVGRFREKVGQFSAWQFSPDFTLAHNKRVAERYGVFRCVYLFLFRFRLVDGLFVVRNFGSDVFMESVLCENEKSKLKPFSVSCAYIYNLSGFEKY